MRMRFCSQNNSSNQMSKHDSKLHQLPYFIRCLAQFSDCIQHHPILDMESRCGRPFSTLKCIISIDLFSVCVCHHKPYLIHVDSIGRSGLLLLCQLCYYTNIQNFSNIWRLNENRGCSCEKAKWWTFRCHFFVNSRVLFLFDHIEWLEPNNEFHMIFDTYLTIELSLKCFW